MNVDPGIFKRNDVRGIAGETLTPEIAEQIGCALVGYLKPKRLVVGHDVRLSGEDLSQAIIRGIVSAGCDAVDIGTVTTDALTFAVAQFGFDGGAMVTASHNPPQWNGFKFCGPGAVQLHTDKGIEQIRDAVLSGPLPEVQPHGSVSAKDISSDYLKKVLTFGLGAPKRKLSVVVDPGNATAAVFLPKLFEYLPFSMHGIHMELDGTFPGRNPNPLEPGAVDKLGAAVRERKADVGVAFDADADRMFLVDENGKLIRGDILIGILAPAFVTREPNAAIVYNLICSHATPEAIVAAGGRPVRSRVGQGSIKEIMKRENAIFGGEVSGHFNFRDFWFADSGLASMVAALTFLSSQDAPLSALAAAVATYARGDEINTRVEDVPGTIARIEQKFSDGKQDTEDGLTVEYADWWFNVRPSNTEPLLRLTVEAANQTELKRREAEVLALIRG